MLLQSNDKNRIVLSYAGMETRAQRNGGKAHARRLACGPVARTFRPWPN